MGVEAFCVSSAAAGLTALAVCAAVASPWAAAASPWAAALLGLRVPRVVERPVVALAVLLAAGVAVGAVSAVAAASGVAAEISLESATVFLLLVAAVLEVLPALRLEALAAAVVLAAEVLGAEAGA